MSCKSVVSGGERKTQEKQLSDTTTAQDHHAQRQDEGPVAYSPSRRLRYVFVVKVSAVWVVVRSLVMWDHQDTRGGLRLLNIHKRHVGLWGKLICLVGKWPFHGTVKCKIKHKLICAHFIVQYHHHTLFIHCWHYSSSRLWLYCWSPMDPQEPLLDDLSSGDNTKQTNALTRLLQLSANGTRDISVYFNPVVQVCIFIVLFIVIVVGM